VAGFIYNTAKSQEKMARLTIFHEASKTPEQAFDTGFETLDLEFGSQKPVPKAIPVHHGTQRPFGVRLCGRTSARPAR
jgi:hypothetical protein